MTDPGLSNRLRQRSRRAGLAVGLTMAATIAICIGGFAASFGFLGPLLSDIVPVPTREREVVQAAPDDGGGEEVAAPTEVPAVEAADEAPPPTPTAEPEVEPTATEEAFEPTHQIRSDQAVNLRPQPSSVTTEQNQPTALPQQTPLQYLNEDEPTNDPNDAPRWMRFRTAEGLEGWIRELDVVEYEP